MLFSIVSVPTGRGTRKNAIFSLVPGKGNAISPDPKTGEMISEHNLSTKTLPAENETLETAFSTDYADGFRNRTQFGFIQEGLSEKRG